MKVTRLVAILLSMAAAGCTSTRTLTLDSPDPFSRLNEVAAQKEGVVVLANGAEMRARALRAERNSVTWFNPETDTVVEVPLNDVAGVRFTRRGRLGRTGLGVVTGTAIGVALGWWCGHSLCGDVDPDPFFFASVAGMAATGGLAGWAIKSKEVFWFPTSLDSKIRTDEPEEIVSQ